MRSFLKCLASVLTICLCGSGAFAQDPQGHRKAVALFDAVCVKAFPDVNLIPKLAQASGFRSEEGAKWTSKDGKAILVFIPEGKRSVKLDVGSKDFVESKGWDYVTLGFSARKPKGACYMIYNTEPKGIAREFPGFGQTGAEIKTRANGVRTGMHVVLAGERAIIEAQPVKLQDKPTMTLFSVKKR